MFLWFIFAIMTAALIWVVLVPYIRGVAQEPGPADAALASVYKAQLSEIDADVDRGTLDTEEADALRAEVARRLLSQDATYGGPSGTGKPDQDPELSRWLILAVVALVPLISISAYLSVGSPLLPSQPHASRQHQSQDGARFAELVRRVEAQLTKHPEDGRGWDVIAPVYMRIGRYQDAVQAWQNAGRLLGESPERVIGYAEAQVFAGNGIVNEEARRALLRGVKLQPDYLPAHFWLAIAKKQDGDLEPARKDLVALLEKAGSASPLGRSIADHIKDIDVRMRGGDQEDSPSQSVLAADSDTRSMIEGMVSGLAARLEDDSSDFEGWQRLVRSYVVLKRPDEAKEALRKARSLFAGEKAKLDRLQALAVELKLET